MKKIIIKIVVRLDSEFVDTTSLKCLCRNTPDDIVPCYNISKGDVVHMTWGEILRKGKRYGYEYPFDAGLWYPNGSIRTNKLMHYFIVFWLQVVPAYLIDGIMILARQKTL